MKLVRWSKSTEIGDFIRDAARGKEFSIEIQGAPREIRVGVPSFNDRTYYLRTRLRRKATEISGMAKIKSECDALAHRAAQRYAYAGFGGMIGYGAVVYWLTFQTTLGWDVMEPVSGESINKRLASHRRSIPSNFARGLTIPPGNLFDRSRRCVGRLRLVPLQPTRSFLSIRHELDRFEETISALRKSRLRPTQMANTDR